MLFVPVSGAFGMGEYARSLAFAQGAQERWPDAAIHFVLSRQAPYAARTPFATTLLPSSPTFHSAEVIELLHRLQPDAVIFDNAGRTAQLRAAKAVGARVVYVSARPRQRYKAFRLRWMRLIDEHWIAYPRFIAGELGWLERRKLRLVGRPQMRFLDVILAQRRGTAQESILARLGCVADGYTLVVPGGGTGHPGAGDATARFLDAARDLARGGTDTVFVGGAAAPSAVRLMLPGALPQSELAELLRGARLVVTNGGSTLLQAIGCGKACIAVPIAGDQAARIHRCVATGVAIAAPLDAAAIRDQAAALWRDEPLLRAMAGRSVALGLADGVDVAVRALASLLELT